MAGNRRAAANIKTDPYCLGCDVISSPTGVSLNEKSLDDAAPGRRIPWTMSPLDDASLDDASLDDASLGQRVLGRCVPWTMRLLNNASLNVLETVEQTDLKGIDQ